ncbi:hypothetical protein EX30DRAFT_296019, partial [Ascodesmis nigricans]
ARGARNAKLDEGARRDPELYILGIIMVGAYLLVGNHFGSHPTSATSQETRMKIIPHTAPWEESEEEVQRTGGGYKYKYYPLGDERREPKTGPGALNSVTIPRVNLPKELHEKFNKFEK